MTWTNQTPTVEGYYWKEHRSEGFATTRTICYVGQNAEGWRVMSQGPLQGYTEYGTPLSLFLPKYTYWAGPIPEPES